MPTTQHPPQPRRAATDGEVLPVIALWLIAIATMIVIGENFDTKEASTDLTYSEFLAKVDAGGIKTASIDPDGKVKGDLTNGDGFKSQIPTVVVGEDLGNRLEAKGVELEGRASATSWAASECSSASRSVER